MSQGIVQTVGGAALIAAGALITVGTFGGGTPLGASLIVAGAGMVLGGVGTLLSRGALQGFATATKSPVAPWAVNYGRCRVGGTPVFINSFGDNDKYLDLVIVLAAHPCQSVDAVLFDQQRIRLIATGSGYTSVPPVQQDLVIADIQRVGSVVTVRTIGDILDLQDGDQVIIRDVPGDRTLNGKFPVRVLSHGSGAVTFTYLCGGPASHVTGAGHCVTTWVNYGAKVYMEVKLGTQTQGQTFAGMISGTLNDGVPFSSVQNPANPWTADCSLVGKTAVFLRLHYNDEIFTNGIPQISFLIHGKNDIYDPRTGSSGYTENAALCIADYLSNPIWGFNAAYGTTIPDAPLITAANLCDEAMALAVPVTSPATTEPRYACNGGFTLATKRGEVLRNLLTSCAGRITFFEGKFIIWPGAWYGVSGTITGTSLLTMAAGGFRWRSTVSISNLYNGVKGTYISPANGWQSSDFPRYAQDTDHGYTWGVAPRHDANMDADGGERRWFDVQLPFTISSSMAQRIAKIELLRRRHAGTGTFPLNMSGYQFAPMDVLEIDFAYFGWTAKQLEVLDARLKFEPQQGDGGTAAVLMGVEIDVQETDSSIYAWSIGEELSPQGYQQAITPDNRNPAPPTDFVASSANGSIFLAWTAPADAFVLHGGHVEVEYQLVVSPEGLWISLAKMDPTITQAEIPGLTVGDQYDVRIRAVNAAGVPSEWVSAAPAGASPLTVGPITVEPPVLWVPNFEAPLSGDALFAAKGFGISQVYTSSGGSALLAGVQIYGDRPADPVSLVIKVRRELVSGISAQTAAAVTTGVIAFGGSGGSVDEFFGRVISKLSNAIGNVSALVPIQDFTITANDTSGNFTVSPDPAAAGCAAGDLFTIRTAPTSADATSFTDSKFNNLYNPGLTIHGNKGNLVLVIAGTGAGQPPQTVVDNDATQVIVSPGFEVVPDATSIIVLLEAIPQVNLPLDTGDGGGDARIGAVPLPNYSRQVVRIEGYTSKGITGPIESVPFRELYVQGPGTRDIYAGTPAVMFVIDLVLRFDTSGVTPPAATALAGAIDNAQTSIAVLVGTNIVNGTVLACGAERFYVLAGGGTASLTVTRAWGGTAAVAHADAAVVNVPGALEWPLVAFSLVPNQDFLFEKASPDINFVKLMPTGSDELPDSEAYHILPDNSANYGTYGITIPA